MKFMIMFMFFITMTSLMIMRKHILMSLLSLEFMMMSIILNVVMFCLTMKLSMYMLIFMMTLLVCEGVLGLSILINMIRCQGNDFMNSTLSW
uniref:NADH-ubiquinone oxidoreductase chain 4L n=1 Tax=Destinoides conspicuus TaxID=3137869 RepID=A0AAU6PBY4_9HEMI